MRLKALVCGLLGAALLASCSFGEDKGPAASMLLAASAQPSAAPASSEPATPQDAPKPAFRYSGELTQGGWLRGTVPAGTEEAFLGNQRLDIAETGHFFAAFDRDEGGEATLRARLEDGSQVIKTLVVAPRQWNIEHVNVAKRSGGSSEAWWKKREPEWNAIQAARGQETGAQGWRQDFIWPVKGRISGRFGSQRVYRGEPGSYHSGIDIAPGAGTPFVAPADGVVTLAAKAPFSLEGHLIMLDHGQGLNSAFLHSASIDVEVGETVKQGQRLGTVGASGRATGPHLHWSLKWRDARLDPLLFAGPMA